MWWSKRVSESERERARVGASAAAALPARPRARGRRGPRRLDVTSFRPSALPTTDA